LEKVVSISSNAQRGTAPDIIFCLNYVQLAFHFNSFIKFFFV
jgi:hypothetical protein